MIFQFVSFKNLKPWENLPFHSTFLSSVAEILHFLTFFRGSSCSPLTMIFSASLNLYLSIIYTCVRNRRCISKIDNNDLQPASFNNLNHERTYHWICAALILSSLVPTILLGLNQNILIFSSFPNFLQFSKVFHIFWPHNLPKCLLFQFPVLSPHDNFLRALLSTKPVCISAGLYISKQLKYRKICDGRWEAFSLKCIFIWKCFPNFPLNCRMHDDIANAIIKQSLTQNLFQHCILLYFWSWPNIPMQDFLMSDMIWNRNWKR